MVSGKKGITKSTCHPDIDMHAKGLCNKCYEKQRTPRYRNATRTKEQRVRVNRQKHLRIYKLNMKQYNKLLDIQNGVCAICKNKTVGNLDVDHCHETGQVRGLLCNRCNTGLSCFKDTEALLNEAINYLRLADI